MSGCAWVTLATNDTYCLGALVLAHSLRAANTKHHLVILVTPQVSQSMRQQLGAVFDLVRDVNVLDSQDAANLALMKRPELGVTLTKIHCWMLTQYTKCVFLDADALVIQNCDELFDREELSASPDPGWPDCFNSGVFVFSPNEQTFKNLIEFASKHGSFDGGDQGLLNLYYSDWATKDIKKHLPFLYNMCSTSTYTYLPAFKQYGGNVKIVHFIGSNKPWLQGDPSSSLSGFLQIWWDIFNNKVAPHLNNTMSGLAGALGSKEKAIIEEQWRKQRWEQGNIDYLGRDSFDKVWQKIMETINKVPENQSKNQSKEKPAESGEGKTEQSSSVLPSLDSILPQIAKGAQDVVKALKPAGETLKDLMGQVDELKKDVFKKETEIKQKIDSTPLPVGGEIAKDLKTAVESGKGVTMESGKESLPSAEAKEPVKQEKAADSATKPIGPEGNKEKLPDAAGVLSSPIEQLVKDIQAAVLPPSQETKPQSESQGIPQSTPTPLQDIMSGVQQLGSIIPGIPLTGAPLISSIQRETEKDIKSQEGNILKDISPSEMPLPLPPLGAVIGKPVETARNEPVGKDKPIDAILGKVQEESARKEPVEGQKTSSDKSVPVESKIEESKSPKTDSKLPIGVTEKLSELPSEVKNDNEKIALETKQQVTNKQETPSDKKSDEINIGKDAKIEESKAADAKLSGESDAASTPTKGPAPSPPTKETAPLSPTKETAPLSPTKETAPSQPNKETAPSTPTKESASSSPTKETAPLPPTKEITPSSPTKETGPSPPTKETAPSPPTKETAPLPPTKEITPSSPTKEVAPSPTTKETAPLPPTKETAPLPPSKETAPSPPTKETAPLLPTKETAPLLPTKESAPLPPTNKDVAPQQNKDVPLPTAKDTVPSTPGKEETTSPPTKDVVPSIPLTKPESLPGPPPTPEVVPPTPPITPDVVPSTPPASQQPMPPSSAQGTLPSTPPTEAPKPLALADVKLPESTAEKKPQEITAPGEQQKEATAKSSDSKKGPSQPGNKSQQQSNKSKKNQTKSSPTHPLDDPLASAELKKDPPIETPTQEASSDPLTPPPSPQTESKDPIAEGNVEEASSAKPKSGPDAPVPPKRKGKNNSHPPSKPQNNGGKGKKK